MYVFILSSIDAGNRSSRTVAPSWSEDLCALNLALGTIIIIIIIIVIVIVIIIIGLLLLIT